MSKRNKKGNKVLKSKNIQPKTNKNSYLIAALIMVMLLAISVVFLVKNSSKNSSSTAIAKSSDLEQREEVRLAWFAAMDQIVAKTGDQPAKVVRDFISQNYVLAIPIGEVAGRINYRLYRGGKKITPQEYPEHAVLLVIVKQGDPVPKLNYNLDTDAVYQQDSRAIYVKYNRFENEGLTCMALTLLHEGFHAWKDYTSNYRPNTGWDDLMEGEREAYLFETNLLVNYLGQGVEKLAAEMSEQVNLKITVQDGKARVEVNSNITQQTFRLQLSTLLPQAKSGYETDRLLGILEIHVFLQKLQLEYPNLQPATIAELQKALIAKLTGREKKL